MIADTMVLRAAPGRRWFAVAVLCLLAGLLLALAFQPGLSLPMRPLMGAAALLVLLLARSLRRATAEGVELRAEGLFDSSGAPIAMMDQIASVDRGVFAFKPSGGFILRLTDPAPAQWAPGLWWRRGRRVGVGGATHSAAARMMAEEIARRIAARPDRS